MTRFVNVNNKIRNFSDEEYETVIRKRKGFLGKAGDLAKKAGMIGLAAYGGHKVLSGQARKIKRRESNRKHLARKAGNIDQHKQTLLEKAAGGYRNLEKKGREIAKQGMKFGKQQFQRGKQHFFNGENNGNQG